MQFQIVLTPSADADLRHFRVFEQRTIVAAIRAQLTTDANIKSRHRKMLAEYPIAPWELRVGNCRVFYEFEAESTVKIIAVGYKQHNDLFIRGKKVEL